MAVHTKKEFADECGMDTNKLSVYISRGQVILLGDKKIDDQDPRNKVFMEKWKAKKKPEASLFDEQKEEPKASITNEVVTPVPNQSYTESERQLKYLDTLKRQKEIERLEIDIQKKKGEVIPSDLVKPVFLQHNQSIITEVHNRGDDFVRIFSKKRDLTLDEIAQIKGELVSWFNFTMDKAIQSSVKAIENIIADHSEKKGVGEHG